MQQINQGADIIYHASGATGAGLFEAASAEQSTFAIGVDADQAKLFPESPVLTSDGQAGGQRRVPDYKGSPATVISPPARCKDVRAGRQGQ